MKLLPLQDSIALWAIILFVAVQYVPQTSTTTTSKPETPKSRTITRNSGTNNSSRWNRQQYASPTSASSSSLAIGGTHACEYKELMTKLHDRVGILASLDEDLRNRLEHVDKKIVQFESSNLARLDSLSTQQMHFLKQLNDMEALQRLTKRQVEDFKDLNLSRATRQAHNDTAYDVDDSKKLDALAVLLTSTRDAINALQGQLESNITRLVQVTSTLQRRLNSVQRRQHQQKQQPAAYSPPSQSPFYATTNLATPLVTSCAQGVPTVNSVLRLQLTATSEPFYVLCEEQAFDGGWTIILNRFNGDVNFQRDWSEYKAGFGNLAGEFFIGLEKLHALTASSVHELIVVMEDFANVQRYARYSLFAVGNEQESYALTLLGDYSGNAGDALTYHAGNKFSTFDNDNDGCLDCNCAQAHLGAWWYNWCEMSNLNGKYFESDYDKVPTYQGMYWHHFHGPNYSLKAARMMIRPVDAEQDDQR